MLNQIELFLFDLDGTLVNSAPDLALALNATLDEFGKPTYPQEKVEKWVGNGARKLLFRGLNGGSIELESEEVSSNQLAELEATFPRFLKYYAEYLHVESHLYAGVLDTLQALQDKGIKMACVTNKPARFTQPLLASFQVAEFFDCVVSGDTLAEMKPSPEPLLFACQELGFSEDDLNHVCMVGDSASDIRAANAAGIISIGLNYGYSQGLNLEDEGATLVLGSIANMLDFIE